MGLFDKIRERLAPTMTARSQGGPAAGNYRRPAAGYSPTQGDPDEMAIERYRYMLRTAPPETVEQAHAEAFAKLTPQQRQRVLADVGSTVPESERATSADPQSLARMATRAEMRQPGTMERVLGGGRGGGLGGGLGMGGMIAGGLLASVAGAFIGTAIAGAFFDDFGAGEDLAADAGQEVDQGFDQAGFDDMGGDFGI